MEVVQATHPIETPVAGQIVKNHLVVDREVVAGEVLVELDSRGLQLELVEREAHLAALFGQCAALRNEIALHSQSVDEAGQMAVLALQEARARYDEAKAAEKYAAEEARRVNELAATGNASVMEGRLATTRAEQRTAAAEAARIAIARLGKDHQRREMERSAQRQALLQRVKGLEGEIETTQATIHRLRHEIGRRTLRSSIDGRVAEAASMPAGSFVQQGDRIGAIVPEGRVRIVAYFHPGEALGRVRAGQPAKMRLHGFPWSQFGSIAARGRGACGPMATS